MSISWRVNSVTFIGSAEQVKRVKGKQGKQFYPLRLLNPYPFPLFPFPPVPYSLRLRGHLSAKILQFPQRVFTFCTFKEFFMQPRDRFAHTLFFNRKS